LKENVYKAIKVNTLLDILCNVNLTNISNYKEDGIKRRLRKVIRNLGSNNYKGVLLFISLLELLGTFIRKPNRGIIKKKAVTFIRKKIG